MNKTIVFNGNLKTDLVVFLYFAAVLLVNISDSPIFTVFYYFVGIISILLYLFKSEKFNKKLDLLSFGIVCFSIINFFCVGNMTFLKMLIMVISIFVSQLFLSDNLSPKPLLFIFIINAAVVFVNYVLYGFSHQVYIESTNNYISIYALAPLIIYYLQIDCKGLKVTFWPALVCCVMSLGGGRMGFVSCSFLLLGVYFISTMGKSRSVIEKLIISLFTLVFVVSIFLFVVPSLDFSNSKLYVVQNFLARGLDGNGRSYIWNDYINSLNNLKNIIFGPPTKDLYYVEMFKNNLHNSYLTIHSLFGIVGIFTVIILSIRCILYCIKDAKWLTLICLVCILLRAYTDYMFGATRLTPILLAFLFLPIIGSHNKEKALN